MAAYLFCCLYTRAAVRPAASLRGHWCMGGSFMPLGAWSIDLLTSALCEAADGSETQARVHDCYRIRKGVTCRTSQSHGKGVKKRQGRDAVVHGVGRDAMDNGWLKTRLREGRRHVPGLSPPQSARGGGDVLHNGHHLFSTPSPHTHTHLPPSHFGAAAPIQSFTSLCGTPPLLLLVKPKPPSKEGFILGLGREKHIYKWSEDLRMEENHSNKMKAVVQLHPQVIKTSCRCAEVNIKYGSVYLYCLDNTVLNPSSNY